MILEVMNCLEPLRFGKSDFFGLPFFHAIKKATNRDFTRPATEKVDRQGLEPWTP